MPLAAKSHTNLQGTLCEMGAAFCFSFDDLGVKLVLGDYTVHQVVLIRSLVGIAIFWGITVCRTWPDALSWVGIALTLSAGLFLLWRETVKAHMAGRDMP